MISTRVRREEQNNDGSIMVLAYSEILSIQLEIPTFERYLGVVAKKDNR